MKAVMTLLMLVFLAVGCGSPADEKKADPADHTGHNHAPGEGHNH
jgi:hypothetical protein